VLAETIGERRAAALLKEITQWWQRKLCKLAPATLKVNDCWTHPDRALQNFQTSEETDCCTRDSTAIALWLKFIFVAASWKTLSESAPRQRRLFPAPSRG
jgi:hypothetical protein